MRQTDTREDFSEPLPKTEREIFVVGHGFHLVGTIQGHGLCIVEGSVKGSIDTEDVKINRGGSVSGDIKCDRIDVAGYLSGHLEAQQVVFRSFASIEGEVHYTTIVTEAGAVVDGELHCEKVQGSEALNPHIFQLPDTLLATVERGRSVHLRMSNGSPIPKWIALRENGISIERRKFEEFEEIGVVLRLVLQVDDQEFALTIP